jgi:hypothetical protein
MELRAELRAAMTGRTVAAERQALDLELRDVEADARWDRRHQRGAA